MPFLRRQTLSHLRVNFYKVNSTCVTADIVNPTTGTISIRWKQMQSYRHPITDTSDRYMDINIMIKRHV